MLPTGRAAGRLPRAGRQPFGVRAALVVGALATWRLSRLIVSEDGPGQFVVRLRRAVDATPLAGVMDCFACTSVWAGMVVSAALFGGRLPARDVVVAGLGMSGAALVAERLLTGGDGYGFLPEPAVESPLVTVAEYADPGAG